MKIYSVHFNRPDFIEIQKKCLDKIEGYKLVVINNQANPEIESKCKELGVEYHNHTHPVGLGSSMSHGSALNFLRGIIDQSDDWCITDHDIFICKNIDLSDSDLISIQQINNGKSYLWPGFIAGRRGIPVSHINFSPHSGFDTGGGTHILVDAGYKVKWVQEEYLGEATTGFLQNSKVIIKISDLAVHYLNGSCWMPTSQTTLEEKNQFLFETIKSMGMEI
jgi:hypothetical protein